MLFLSLMLLGQSAGLDADTGKAARQCVSVYAVDFGRTANANPIPGVSQMTYLGMAAARAEGLTGSPFLDRAIAILDEMKVEVDTGKAPAATASAAECDKRFPLARASAPAPLPRNTADRDILCVSALSLLAGSVEDIPQLSAELEPLVERFSDRLDAALKAKGVSPANEEAALADAMLASLDIGNAEAIMASCKKLPA